MITNLTVCETGANLYFSIRTQLKVGLILIYYSILCQNLSVFTKSDHKTYTRKAAEVVTVGLCVSL